MKSNHLLSLLMKDFTTIKVVFEAVGQPDRREFVTPAGHIIRNPHEWSNASVPTVHQYTYKVRKNDKPELGDVVVVMTPKNGLKFAKVVEVHDEPKIDLDSNIEYKWIVQHINFDQWERLNELEEKFKETVRRVEAAKARERMVKDFREHLGDGTEARLIFDNAAKEIAGMDSVSVLNQEAFGDLVSDPKSDVPAKKGGE